VYSWDSLLKNAKSGILKSLWFPHCVVSPSSSPFQRANCKCRYKEMPPENAGFKPNPDKGVVTARTQTLSDFCYRHGFEIPAGSQFSLSSRAELGPSRRQPLWVWGLAQQCKGFQYITIIKTPVSNNLLHYKGFLNLWNYSFLNKAGFVDYTSVGTRKQG
jgi:hypothetical protein